MAVVSVFWGTPPPKPFGWKSRPDASGAPVAGPQADPFGGEPWFSRAAFRVGMCDIIPMSVSHVMGQHGDPCVLRLFQTSNGRTKNPATGSVGRVGKSSSLVSSHPLTEGPSVEALSPRAMTRMAASTNTRPPLRPQR
jgi:hypothetical protein